MKPRVLMVGRTRYRLPLNESLARKFDALRERLDLRVLAAAPRGASSGDATEARRAAADFHEVVSTMAGNAVLDEISALTASRMRWMLGQHDDLGAMAAEHAALLAAVRDGDVERADALAREHLRGWRPA